MPDPLDLAGHVAIVTGANHGIGAATALALAEAGASSLLTYLRIESADHPDLPDEYRAARARDAHTVVERITELGGRAAAVEADLSDAGTPTTLFDAAEATFGPVDILINSASSWVADSFAARGSVRPTEVTAETLDHQFNVDARGSALMIAEFARRHRRHDLRWGRIVGITSGGPGGFPGEVSYGAAKSAMENYTMSAARELAPYGVAANVVHPPVTDTGWVTDEVRALVESSDEMVHIAGPEEVAEVIVFLCSDRARLVSGNRIRLR